MGVIKTNKGAAILVDDDLLESLSTRTWSLNHGYAKARFGKEVLMLHRVVMAFPDGQIDHINGDKLDNRRSNLRLVTHAQNQANRKVRHDSKSGFKGVMYDHTMSRRKRWAAFIRHDGKNKRIGRYFTAEEAAKAYDNTALELRGEFARTNFGRIKSLV